MTYELFSWSHTTGHWMAVAQGTEEEMEKAAESKYAGARKQGIEGCAYWVDVEGDVPGLRPEDLGIEIT